MADIEQIEQGGVINKPPCIEIPECKFQAKNWVMTYHNYPKDIFEQIEQHLVPLCEKYVFGKELGKSGNTPHIQGAFILKKKMRQDTLWRTLGAKFYLDKMNGKWVDQKYCAKEAGEILTNVKFPKPLVKMTYDKLREEQRQIADQFKEDEDPLFGRKIYWFWETKGCWGKSILTTYMIDQMGAFECSGKGADIFCGITSYIEENDEGPGIIIYDVPRSNIKYINYGALEKVKDGKFFSSKYESKPVRFNRPHIICFANEPPELEGVSQDRWIVEKLVKCDCPPMRNTEFKNLRICPKCGT